MHTEGSGKLNIFMQLVATSLDLGLNIKTAARQSLNCIKNKQKI